MEKWISCGRTALDDACATFGEAPKAVDVDDVGTDAGHGELEKPLTFGGFEEQALLLSQPVSDAAAADFRTRGIATAEMLDVVLAGLDCHCLSIGEDSWGCNEDMKNDTV